MRHYINKDVDRQISACVQTMSPGTDGEADMHNDGSPDCFIKGDLHGIGIRVGVFNPLVLIFTGRPKERRVLVQRRRAAPFV